MMLVETNEELMVINRSVQSSECRISPLIVTVMTALCDGGTCGGLTSRWGWDISETLPREKHQDGIC